MQSKPVLLAYVGLHKWSIDVESAQTSSQPTEQNCCIMGWHRRKPWVTPCAPNTSLPGHGPHQGMRVPLSNKLKQGPASLKAVCVLPRTTEQIYSIQPSSLPACTFNYSNKSALSSHCGDQPTGGHMTMQPLLKQTQSKQGCTQWQAKHRLQICHRRIRACRTPGFMHWFSATLNSRCPRPWQPTKGKHTAAAAP
jgi:hypothetical protein